jgi:hypothetical protein
VGPSCQRAEVRENTLSGFNPGGPWAVSGTRPNGSPAALFLFFYVF